MNYRKYMPARAIINTVNHTVRAKVLARLFTRDELGRISREATQLTGEIPRLQGSIKPVRDFYRSILYSCAAMGRFIAPSLKAACMAGPVQYITADPLAEYTDALSAARNITVLQQAAGCADMALRAERGGLALPVNINLFCCDMSDKKELSRLKTAAFYSPDTPLYINLGFVSAARDKDNFAAILENLCSVMTQRDNLTFAFVSRCPVQPGGSLDVTEYSYREMEKMLSRRGFNIYEETRYTDSIAGGSLHFVLAVKSLKL